MGLNYTFVYCNKTSPFPRRNAHQTSSAVHAISGPVSNLNHFTSVGSSFDARNALNGPCDAMFVRAARAHGHSIKARYYLGACISSRKGAEAKERKMLSWSARGAEEEWWLHRWIHTRTQLLMLLHIIFLPACVLTWHSLDVSESRVAGSERDHINHSGGKSQREESITLTMLCLEKDDVTFVGGLFYIWARKMFTQLTLESQPLQPSHP